MIIKSQDNLYPEKMRPDAPLVLAIPGLNIPGVSLKQEDHFGNLVSMLAERGIPSRVLAYDTDKYPLAPVASLGFNQTSIAATRVGPSIVDEIQRENSRRADKNLPAVKEAVVFSYSQGSVIASRILQRLYIFKKTYNNFCRMYGQEWRALLNDPEFIYLMDALSDYTLIRNIKVQREADYKRDPDFQNFYERAKKKLKSRTKEFLTYLKDPSVKYPGVTDFEPPETGKYPKRYDKLRECAERCFSNDKEYSRLNRFFEAYATYRDLLDVDFRFFSAAGSFFGSPRANESYGFLQTVPIFMPLAGRELRQIKDTRLGSEHQTREIETLFKLKGRKSYPFGDRDTLFILGVNGDQGDGIVDQSSAHLVDHVFVYACREGDGIFSINSNRLPDLTVVPLRVVHLPKDTILFGSEYGAAYMEKGNPVFDFLTAFIDRDWRKIEGMLGKDDIRLKQFMVEVSLGGLSDEDKKLLLGRKSLSKNITIDREYYNSDSGIVVWTGRFTGKDEYLNILGPEDDRGSVTFETQGAGGKKSTLEIPVYPGCNTFVKVEKKP